MNVAYVFMTERLTDEAREKLDRQLAGFSGPTPERGRNSQQELMSAMGLTRR